MSSEDSKPWAHLYVPNPATTRGQASKFDVSKDGSRVLYCVGSIVVIRGVRDAALNDVYPDHKALTTAARFSPNGEWVASGDETGMVRVWAVNHPDKLLKLETQPFAGEVLDLAWGPEGRRIVAVGKGRSVMMKAFTWDTGNSLGDMVGHSKHVNCVAFKPTRPYRVATGGEDFKVVFFAGPPFKFNRSLTGHTNFVNAVAYAPDGSCFATASADKQVILYDGATADELGRLEGEGVHKMGIYGLAFSPDASMLATCSADRSVRVWEVASRSLKATLAASAKPGVEDMFVGVAWKEGGLFALTLAGDIVQLDPSAPDAPPSAVLQGAQSALTSLAADPASGALVAGSASGRVVVLADGAAKRVQGKTHSNHSTGVAVGEGQLFSVGWDDTLRAAPLAEAVSEEETGVEGQPVALANAAKDPTLLLVATHKGVALARGASVAAFEPAPWSPCAAALSPDGALAAVGSQDAPYAIHLFAVAGGALTHAGTLEGHSAAVQALAFSPDGAHLAAGDSARDVRIWSVADRTPLIQREWVAHSARINGVAWSPSGARVASSSLDTHVIVWNMESRKAEKKFMYAHKESANACVFLDEDTVASAGKDGCVKVWKM